MTSTSQLLSLAEVALRSGVEVTFVEQLVEYGVIERYEGGEFSRDVTLRVRRCVRLQEDLGVNLEGAAVIVELLDRIEALEQELQVLRSSAAHER